MRILRVKLLPQGVRSTGLFSLNMTQIVLIERDRNSSPVGLAQVVVNKECCYWLSMNKLKVIRYAFIRFWVTDLFVLTLRSKCNDASCCFYSNIVP